MAETFLATWLDARALPPTAMTIGSKWGYSYIGDWRLDAPVHERKDLSIATLRRQLAESRAILGGALSLYQIHSATIESGVLDDQSVLAELARLAAEGLVIGLTVTGPKQSDTIRACPRRQDRRRESVSDRSGDLERARAVGGFRIGGRHTMLAGASSSRKHWRMAV